jgi:hypothetical protein
VPHGAVLGELDTVAAACADTLRRRIIAHPIEQYPLENAMPKGQQRSNREKKKPKKERAPVAPRTPGFPQNPWKK